MILMLHIHTRLAKFLLFSLVFAVSACSRLHAAEIADFQMMKPLEITDPDAEIGVFLPDHELYSGTLNLRRDMRLFSADGAEQPFNVFTRRELTAENPVYTMVPAEILLFSEKDDGSVHIRCRISSDNPVSRMEIVTRAVNFNKQIKVFTAEDSSSPVAEGSFFDFSSRIDFRNTSFSIEKQSPSRTYDIFIENFAETKESPVAKLISGDSALKEQFVITEKPKIDDICFSQSEQHFVAKDVSKPIPCEILSSGYQVKDGTTVVTFTTRGLPLTGIAVHCSDSLYVRRFTLTPCGGNDDFQVAPAASGKIVFSDLSSYSVDETVINFAPVAAHSWKLVIYNDNLAPLHDLKITCSGPEECVSFLQKGVALPLTCYYAPNAPLPFPDYPQSAFLVPRDNSSAPHITAELLPETGNPAYKQFVWHGHSSIGKIAFFVFMGLVMVAALIFIFRSIGRIEKIDD